MDEGAASPLLPNSLVYQIFLNLGHADVLATGLVCRQWQAVACDEFLWKALFYRYYHVDQDVPRHPAAVSWYEEFRWLTDIIPCVEVQTLREHSDQVLHLSFSQKCFLFASCSKNCTIKIWDNDLAISLLHSSNMRPYNWSYTLFSQFNWDDTLLLVSGVFVGPHSSSSGEIAVISLDNFTFLSRVRNKPYDVFGCWLNETKLISGNLHRIGHITSCSVLWLNIAFQGIELENVNMVKRLFKIQNLNASTIRAATADVFDPRAGCPGGATCGGRGVVRFLDDLEEQGRPLLSEQELETKVAELLARSRTKLPQGSGGGPPPMGEQEAQKKYLIFTTGCLTYSPRQIGIKQILAHQITMAGLVLGEERWSDEFFDSLDHVIDVQGHIIGMGLFPDQRYLYVNSRSCSLVSDPMHPPPIAEEIDLHVFDLKTMWEVKQALRVLWAYTPNDESFFIFLDISRDLVDSGAEDRRGYIWDQHYNICLAKFQHEDVVNSVAFSPVDQELLLSTNDDTTFKAWRLPRVVRAGQPPHPGMPRFSWLSGQKS
uniref:F-box and WD repeat domain containing 5 n=1 Tax=Ornithorhynchus anatinus TaxID=9258 RepID=A0A6I8PB50_ORNAN